MRWRTTSSDLIKAECMMRVVETSLANTVALVTGASSGIGEATALGSLATAASR